MVFQDCTNDHAEVVADDKERYSLLAAEAHEVGKTAIDWGIADETSQRVGLNPEVAYLIRKALGRGQIAALPGRLPGPPSLRNREALDHRVENIADRNGVIEIKKKGRFLHRRFLHPCRQREFRC